MRQRIADDIERRFLAVRELGERVRARVGARWGDGQRIPSPTQTIALGLGRTGGVVAAASILGGVGTVAFQVYRWLRTGEWLPLPISVVFQFFDIDVALLYEPTDWYGAAKLGQWLVDLPLSLGAPILGVAMGLLVQGIGFELWKRRNPPSEQRMGQ